MNRAAPNDSRITLVGGVLAVMDGWAGLIKHTSGNAPADLISARAAVAELIEAAQEMVEGVYPGERVDARARLRAALAKVQP